ncbi:DUF1284 domain-containing protein [Brucella intermedia]|uniref:DUF1284 domain-containing protein n=1 Tax=Brucella TaxID=234 RepID=UPI0007C2A58C|nr:DUF1284 domain-containing protein [Brucella intermedia]PJT20710.1 DUF1284 domain-containing protein [Ochrobactrum sp. 30A/1000/2015]PJT39967.1 DUF1284 domain-containing protein [Ochrobactrum sp. 27A/999/2015]PJT43471.1 DUF1284 domain-containing protein [Ochrobactrum sp. 23A/997/2015]KAB2708167.1 DUF1284 domain-containing protein [Brucella intermedia]MCO7738273.1 DUF1284 domain-containing protein [Brucella intermedia]
MTIRLRGHHLLCMLTYVGKGYSPAFVENYDAIAGRLSRGEDILLIDGPDDICAPLLCGGDCHCYEASVRRRDALALKAVGELLGTVLATPSPFTLDAERLAAMRSSFADGALRTACEHCEWSDLCTRIAGPENFEGVKVTAPVSATESRC